MRLNKGHINITIKSSDREGCVDIILEPVGLKSRIFLILGGLMFGKLIILNNTVEEDLWIKRI